MLRSERASVRHETLAADVRPPLRHLLDGQHHVGLPDLLDPVRRLRRHGARYGQTRIH